MRISELPTPRLRARAYELVTLSQTIPPDGNAGDLPLDGAFDWSKTTEGHNFWSDCFHIDLDKAKELQPDLFKPVDGKPHIKLEEVWAFTEREDEMEVVGYCLRCSITTNPNIVTYVLEVQDGQYYTTIQEAVDALYSFKRATDVAGEVV